MVIHHRGRDLSPRALIPLVALALVVSICWLSRSSDYYHALGRSTYTRIRVLTMPPPTDTSSLVVTARQTAGAAASAPPRITFGVTNRSSRPLTVLVWDSPLDPLVLQLGHLEISVVDGDGGGPGESPAPPPPPPPPRRLELPVVQVRRKMPPGDGSLVTIEPGETAENEVELREALVPPEELRRGRVTAVCRGAWVAVWSGRAGDVGEEARAALGAGPDVLTGRYETLPLQIVVDAEA